MTESPLPEPTVPAWTLGDRMRKAREHAGLKQSELAGEIGIARSSIVNYESGRTEPSRPILLSWALRCGVDHEWLSGTGPSTWGGTFAPRDRGVISTN
jgi:transcriptional regulator with XRE-family HTH domain